MPIAVSIFVVGRSIKVNRSFLRKVVTTVLRGEGVTSADISLAFVDDRTIARLNNTYLNHAGPTDVLTFPLSKPNAKKMEGEIVIGAEVARRVGDVRGHRIQAELALYVIHGLLHLCGYDDQKKTARLTMLRQQRYFLELLGLPAISD